MSSVFLYLAIVAIWAFILVPRWLRRSHPAQQIEVDVDVDYRPDPGHGEEYEYDDDGYGYNSGANPAEPERTVRYTSQSAEARPAPSRSRVLQARRRLLTMLVLLMVAAAGCTVLKLAAWWVCIPPAGMLGTYLLLLRETALADAEQGRRRAATELRVQAARHRAHSDLEEQPEPEDAQIIDISARVGDQLYDQYADATVRAVGD